MLEGNAVNLRVIEKEDLSLYAEWFNNPLFSGEYLRLQQESKTKMEKLENLPPNKKRFIIEKKDGSKIGLMSYFPSRPFSIGFALIPSERGKGYCTEAAKIIVDYLFLSKDIVRIQAHTDTSNMAAQKVLEKAGFKKEGTIRKSSFNRGEWRDHFLYSILREEWKEPKILIKTTHQGQ